MYVGINGIHSTAITSEELGFIFHSKKKKQQNNPIFLFYFFIYPKNVFKERNILRIEFLESFLFNKAIVKIIKCFNQYFVNILNTYIFKNNFLFRFRFSILYHSFYNKKKK